MRVVWIAVPRLRKGYTEAVGLHSQRIRAKPTTLCRDQDTARGRRDEELGPLFKDLVENHIHFRISECAVTSLCVAERSEDAVYRDAANERAGVAVRWCRSDGFVEGSEELRIVCDLVTMSNVNTVNLGDASDLPRVG